MNDPTEPCEYRQENREDECEYVQNSSMHCRGCDVWENFDSTHIWNIETQQWDEV
jgi:hypothetical protein